MNNKNKYIWRVVLLVFCTMTAANIFIGSLSLLITRGHSPFPLWLIGVFSSPIYTLMISVFLGTMLSMLFSRLMLKPLGDLINATKKVASGDFSVRVENTESHSEINALVNSFNDMTRELGSNELFKKDFINSFSHEFKTPIVSIRGFARQLERDDITDNERREYAGIIVRESERLSNMATNILLLNKLENQSFMPEKKFYRIDEQLRENVLLFEKQWSEKDLELDIDLNETYINGNEEMLSHVFINVIGNAVKFTPNGGKLIISCARDEKNVIVSIKDTGIGMDSETVKRIFDQFYQGDVNNKNMPSHSQAGNGLGLPLAKRIVELSGGRIDVNSTPGTGSEFIITLPYN